LLGLFLSRTAAALSGDDAIEQANQALQEVGTQAPRIKATTSAAPLHKPATMLAAADLHLRTGQAPEAILVLNKIIELARQGKATRSVEAEADYLLGDAYVTTGELYSARRQFERVTDRAGEAPYTPFAGRAASRLVDVALLLERRETLPDVLARVERLTAVGSTEALVYARAKALLALERYDDALAAGTSLQSASIESQRAAYLCGVAAMRKAEREVPEAARATQKPDYSAALEAFKRSVRAASGHRADAHAEIGELSLLAIARLEF